MPEDISVPDILPPSDDGVFKTIMTHPDGEPVLRGVMSDVLDMNFVSVEVHNVELPISGTDEKQERFDVNCRAISDSGIRIEVEMQADPMKGDSAATKHRNIKSRAIHNVCDLFTSQPGRGADYGDFERCFQITFCGYTVFPGRTDFVRRFSIRDEQGIELADNIGIIFIELTKMREVLKKPVKDMTPLEQWCIFFKYANNPKYRGILNELTTARREIKVATELLTNISRDEHERALFLSRRIAQRDREHNYAVARKEGLQEGRQEGRQEGHMQVFALMEKGYTLEQIKAILRTEQDKQPVQ
ncbi:MAG: Rpn family recombination-promoting nuclease/putative transposase [Oscillospiraceae bacterium]|jgi:predicted transposase/invertase (TIGR01784 family)|nr:Rpn family recombination-promoting nuclease/putative transposase [Oscillospiraceae bacterium]